MSELEPIDPSRALELYLEDRRGNLSRNSIITHRSRLSSFVEWLDEREVTNLNELTGRLIKEYQTEGRKDGNWALATEKGMMDTTRVFIRWCESIEAVESGLSQRVQSPAVDDTDNARHEQLDSQTAQLVLNNLERYHYCSRAHVTLAVMWHTMARKGAVRSLDVEDYDADERYLRFKHRPDTDTPLKNKTKSQRHVAISESIADLLDDWIENKRPDVTDDYGREPLITTSKGRIAGSTISRYAYKWTQPCRHDGSCPLGRDPKTCEATDHNRVSACPESLSSHPLRRGSITHWLRSDVPSQAVSSRADVSERVIEKHYDERSERERMEQRRSYLGNI